MKAILRVHRQHDYDDTPYEISSIPQIGEQLAATSGVWMELTKIWWSVDVDKHQLIAVLEVKITKDVVEDDKKYLRIPLG